MKKAFFWLFILLFWIVLLEVVGFFVLNNISLQGKYESGCKQGHRIRQIILEKATGNEEVRFLPMANLGYIQNPAFYEEGVKQNNSIGLRGKEIPLVPSTDEIRILCMGGSTTYGFGVVQPDSAYPALLEKLLRAKTGKNYKVINGGLEGGTSFEEIQHYLYKLRYFKPQIVIIHSGGNDAISCSTAPNYSPDFTNFRNYDTRIKPIVPVFKWLFASRFLSAIYVFSTYGFYQEYKGIIGSPKMPAPEWFKGNVNDVLKDDSSLYYYSFTKNFETLMHLYKSDNLKIIALPFALNDSFETVKKDTLYAQLNKLNNQLMLCICKKEKVPWVPYTYSSISPQNWLDDCHLTGEGNKQKAALVLPYILDSLASQ